MKLFFLVFVFALFGVALFMLTLGRSKKRGCCGDVGCGCKKGKK